METLNILLAGATRVDQVLINTTVNKYIHLLSISLHSTSALNWEVSVLSFQSSTTS